MSNPAMPCSQNLLPSFVGSSITSDSTVSLGASRARSRSQSQADIVTVNAVPVSASQDIVADAESSSGAVQSASHYITTRSATGRLAKRPKRDHSPPLSPPRKIGKYLKSYHLVANSKRLQTSIIFLALCKTVGCLKHSTPCKNSV